MKLVPYEYVARYVHYYGEDPDIERAIVAVFVKLPIEVIDFIFRKCAFLSVGRSCLGMVVPQMLAQTNPEDVKGRWLILLEERTPKRQIKSVIAHEIAHAWLEHNHLSLACPKECEIQVALLAKQWGFKGWGADEDFVTRHMKETDLIMKS